MAVGGYTTAALAARGVPFYLTVPLAGALTALVGMVFAIPSLRLKGLYLAIATLAAHFIVAFVVVHWEKLTGGVAGITVEPPRLGGFAFDSDHRLYYLILGAVIGHLFFAKNLFRTRMGKAFVAIRDHDISAEVMGVEVFRYKVLAFGVSSFYVGIAGSLFAYQARLISPESFPLDMAIDQLAHDHHRRPGHGPWAGILGAMFITLLPEVYASSPARWATASRRSCTCSLRSSSASSA